MKALKYRLLVCLLFALLLTAVFGAPVLAETKGTCGENLAWKVENETLTISGTGKMDDYIEPYEPASGTLLHAPWLAYSDSIREIVIEEGVTSIGKYAFMSLWQVTSVSLPDSLVSIGESAFNCCGISEIRIPDSVAEIQTNTFALCGSLERITLPDKLQEIGFGVFQSCTKLKSITLPASLKIIGDDAFLGCESLEEIDLSSVSHIDGRGTFINCTSLKNIIVTKGSTVEQYCIDNRLPYTAVESPETAPATEGVCGYNLAWKVENGTLTISGTGAMADFRENESVQKPYLWYTVPGTTAPWDGLEFSRLVIEEGVTSIGENAFNCHVELVSVILPDTLTSIGRNAFCYCENLSDIIFPDVVETIGPSAFGDCRGLKSVILPESLKNIEFGAFQCCNQLNHVVLPENVETIAENAFYACFALREITLPASLVRIADGAFSYCDDLWNYIVVKGSYAEKYCADRQLPYSYAQTSVLFDEQNGSGLGWKLENGTLTISGTGNMEDYMRLVGGDQNTSAPWDGQKITQVVIEPGVTSVGAFAFWGCEQLKTVTLPDTVTEIGKFAFEGCVLLREIQLPEGVTAIGRKAFSKCSSLRTVTLPASVGSIGENAFIDCGKLNDVVVAPGSYAEEYCTVNNLPHTSGAAVPEATREPVQISVEKAENTCGKDLTWKLEEDGTLRISGTGGMDDYVQVRREPDKDGKTRYGSSAPWSENEGITRVVVGEGVTSIGAYAFEGCGMKEVSLPATLTVVGQSAFEYCEKLETVELPDTVTEIGMFAFNGCTGLTGIRLPASLASVAAAAFDTCTALTEIVLPEGVTDIGMYAFHNCVALKTVTLPASLTMIAEYAFDGCQALKTIIVPKDSYAEKYCIQKGLAYIYPGSSQEAAPTEAPQGICGKNLTWRLDDAGTLTISGFGKMDDYDEIVSEPDEYGGAFFLRTTAPWYGQAIRQVIVEEGVERIGSYAFYSCEDLRSIWLPDTLKAVGSYAFGFTKLVDVELPDSLTSIGSDLFFGCHSLESVRLPAGIKLIPVSMFCGCDVLKDIVLPETLQRIDGYAFSGCSILREINLPAAVFDIGSMAFQDCESLENVIVAKGSYAEEYCLGQGLPYTYTDGTKPENSGKVYAEGRCGVNLSWKLEDRTLTISGTGKMDDYTTKMTGNYVVDVTSPWDGRRVDTVVVEEGVTSIGDRAFAYLDKVTSVYLPETLVSIGDEAFGGTGITAILIPESVETIGSCAFQGCYNLRKIKLPPTLDCIGFALFENCCSLADIVIPDTVTYIDAHAFGGCTSLNEFRIPDSVTKLDKTAFEYCPGLRLVVGRDSAAESFCIQNNLKYSYAENE